MKEKIKICPKCEKEFTGRKKFCCNSCRYWYNSIKKDKERHLPPFRKRNKNYFSMITGYHNSLKGNQQGKRCGHMVKGSMAAIINITTEEWAEVNYDNIKTHFTSISFYRPSVIKLGDGTYIREEDIKRILNIKIDF